MNSQIYLHDIYIPFYIVNNTVKAKREHDVLCESGLACRT